MAHQHWGSLQRTLDTLTLKHFRTCKRSFFCSYIILHICQSCGMLWPHVGCLQEKNDKVSVGMVPHTSLPSLDCVAKFPRNSCAEVPMRERHECHCMLFLKDDNPFAPLSSHQRTTWRIRWRGVYRIFGSQYPKTDDQNDHHISEISIRGGATWYYHLSIAVLLIFAVHRWTKQPGSAPGAHRLRSECSTIDLEEIMKMKDDS